MIAGTLTSTSFGAALSATGSTAGLAFTETSDNTIVIVATSVTTGAAFTIDGKTPSGAWVPLYSFSITANGSFAVPVRDRIKRRRSLDINCELRVTCVTRTDGSYACTRNAYVAG